MSINNKRSYTEYTVTQPTTDFAIGFDDYDEGGKDNILVTLNGVLVESLGYAAIRKNASTVSIAPAITEGTVRLTRETDIDEPFHKFTAGALFSAKSMDENFQQVRHSQQEVRDGFVFLEYNTNGIVQASKEATAQAKAATVVATASAVRAETAADTAVQAVGSLQGVVNAATTATTNANAATATATTATSQATAATTSAQNAAQAANIAKQEATAAATNANAATVDTLAATGRANEAADVVADLVVGKVRAQDVSTSDGSTQAEKNTEFRNELDALPFIEGILPSVFVSYFNNFTGAALRSLSSKLTDFISVKDFGAVGDGKTDDTAAIQAAFDSEKLGAIYFPDGLYKVTGQGEACLTLRKNRNILGSSRGSTIRADFAGAETSLLKIAITDNDGLLDCRGLKVDSISAFHNGGGKHGLHIEGGMQILNATFPSCQFSKGTNPNGHGIYVKNNLAHSELSNVGFDTAYMACYDANVFRKCISFGKGAAITYDCELGVRNNTVEDCTLVNRDGQVKIINGDNIRIRNNQMELAQVYSPEGNQSEFGAMVTVLGVDRPVYNTIIEDNNFGGGTNLDRSIYLDNARRTVADKNNFISVNTADIELSSNSSYNFIGHRNTIAGSDSNPRLGGLNKLKIVDSGVSNYGVVKTTEGVGGWGRIAYIKGEDSTVVFTQPVDGTTTTTGTKIATIERGFRPAPKNSNTRKNLLPDTSGATWAVSSTTKIQDDTTINPHTSGALRVSATTGLAPHTVYTTTVSSVGTTPHTLSMYIKRATSTSVTGAYIEMSVTGKNNSFSRINVDTSSLQATMSSNSNFYTDTSAQVIDAGNGWYRVVATFSLVEAGSVTVDVSPNKDLTSIAHAYTGTADTTILLYGMQIESGSTATGYQQVMEDTSLLDMEHTVNILAVTDAGVGYVTLDSLGNLKVGQLPSAKSISISPYQSTANGS